MRRQCTAVVSLVSLLLAGSGFFQSAYSYKLLLMIPPILAAGSTAG